MTDAGSSVAVLVSHAGEHLRKASAAISGANNEALQESLQEAYNRVGAALVVLGSHVAQERVMPNG